MADGILKMMNMYTKVSQMAMYMAQNGMQNYSLQFQRIFEQITRMSGDASLLYQNSGNGSGFTYVRDGIPLLRMQTDDLYANLQNYENDYLSRTDNPDSNVVQMIRDLKKDCEDDRNTLQRINHQPGKSFMESVYAAQQELENGPQMQQNLPLPGENTLYGQNYPGQDTLYRQNYPGQNTLYGQNTGANQMNPNPVPFGGANEFPGQDTLRRHEGQLGPAVQPFMQQQLYGSNTFYRNQMDMPNREEIQQNIIRNQPKDIKYLQIWTVAPLTEQIINQTYGTNRAASDKMLQINRELSSLFRNVIYPFNPSRSEIPLQPGPQDTEKMLQETGQLINKLAKWKQDYTRSTSNPSEQVLFMTDNVMKKLQDDCQVIQMAGQNGLTVPQAAFRYSKLEKHYGLENDRKTPVKAPVRQTAPQNVSKKPEAPKEKKTSSGIKDLNVAAEKLEKLEKALDKADPKWMLSSSGAYSKMKKSVKSLNRVGASGEPQTVRKPDSARPKDRRL